MSVTIDGTAQFLRTQNGWMARVGTAVMFFGDKNSHIESLRTLVPDAEFNFLKQVHSDRITIVNEVSDTIVEADAQIANSKDIALGIQTADCVPVLISNGSMIAAIHAGWRGLESSIVEKTVKQMRTMGAKPDTLQAAIGPHIAKNSFEVGRDVAERLLSVYRKLAFNPCPLAFPHSDESKRYVDLSVLAQAQLIQAGIPEKNVTVLRTDTLKDQDFFSYRRNKESAGRQISFIVLR